MFHSLRTKILLSFASIVMVSVGTLFYFFSTRLVEERQRSLLDLLSLQIQIDAHEVAEKIHSGHSLEEIAESTSLGFYSMDQNSWNLISSIEVYQPLPPSGLVIRPCDIESHGPHYCAAIFLPGAQAWLLENTPKASLRGVIQAELSWMTLIFLLTLVFGVFLTALLSTLIVNPLKLLTKAASRVSDGNFQALELPTHRKDELGSLAQSFSKMTKNLQERERHLALSGLKLAHSERLASLGQFGASIAHEIKNPLSAVMGYARQLSKADTAPSKEAVEIILKESQRCQEILQQMLRFSRQDHAQSKPFRIHEVIESSILLMKAEGRQRQIQIEFEKRSEPIVQASPQEIQQVVINLLLNAIQASPNGSRVRIQLAETSTHVVVSVADQGPGIPPELQEQIFDPFFSTKSGEEGSGLGLSVSQDLIQKLGGQISVTSSEAQGSRFEIELPKQAT